MSQQEEDKSKPKIPGRGLGRQLSAPRLQLTFRRKNSLKKEARSNDSDPDARPELKKMGSFHRTVAKTKSITRASTHSGISAVSSVGKKAASLTRATTTTGIQVGKSSVSAVTHVGKSAVHTTAVVGKSAVHTTAVMGKTGFSAVTSVSKSAVHSTAGATHKVAHVATSTLYSLISKTGLSAVSKSVVSSMATSKNAVDSLFRPKEEERIRSSFKAPPMEDISGLDSIFSDEWAQKWAYLEEGEPEPANPYATMAWNALVIGLLILGFMAQAAPFVRLFLRPAQDPETLLA